MGACRHQFGRVVAGVSEHQPLITGADHAVLTIHALVDVGRLTVEPDLDLAALRVYARHAVSIAGVAQDVGHDRHCPLAYGSEGFGATGLELTRNNHALISQQGLAGNARRRVVA
jgi:hypothetical protein